ncbi:MaoC/PaaZ C-terminal domain-containing protein [Brevibacillus choshinensis]|uniref:MaoC/PaaZ C-terminal domain-containing protein n=1 Tax=Brevibacillus choshinensis TaxID=54911 RepID=UPI002E213C5F|nr:MaoC/PaaZ C-terminal domain-containing protein [Brevibacillus choshinensis]
MIAHGMMIMGFIGQAIGTWFHPDQLLRFSVRFQAMTRPGEQITVRGEIVGETDDTWKCEAVAINEAGEKKVSARFDIRKA